jgi:hypothetical protein
LRESADLDYDVEITDVCGDFFKTLTHREQEAIDKKIAEIKLDPSCGDYFTEPELRGVLHTHVLGNSSNCVVAWSKQEKPKRKIIIEAVGSHDNIDKLKRLRRKRAH